MRLMRVAVAVVVWLGFAVAPAAAQTIGFKIGPTFSKMDENDPDESTETLTNFGGGGFIRFGFAGLALQAEVLALTKGSQGSFDDPILGSGDVKLKMNYIEIPVTAMYSLGSGPYLFAGPSVAFETGCEGEVELDDGDSFEGDCDDVEAGEEPIARKKTDVSLVGGAGFQFPVGPGRLLVEGRYIYGLTNLNDEPNDNSDVKHRTWFVAAGFAIPIGGLR
jgi:hypothetical protein